ncbi:cyclin-D-binding Myb-like transcription factor 1 isoform X2 [Dysidea avara]|uniref:cyclin-D-binding Myb-like transcription factor 1 isoform X2 n=1 Tax=Dysidea avara TaxID=196820 RepID=UPI00332B2D83
MSDSGSSSGHVSEMPPHKRRKISTSDDVTPPGLHLQEPDPYDHLHRSMFGSVNELGGEWIKGRWRKAEIALLQSNISRYCQKHDISNLSEFIQERSKERSEFYIEVAWGIKRPLFHVYQQILRLFPSASTVGRFTEDEVEQLKMLQQQYGNRWAKIGSQMDRTDHSVRVKFDGLGSVCGTWSKQEVELLVSAVTECGEDDINWKIVARKVKTRNSHQCRQKWVFFMCWKQLESPVSWCKLDNIRLVQELSQSSATDEEEVDWKKMAESDWPPARSGSYLRCKWTALRRQVANYELRSFRVGVLCEVVEK